MFQNFEATSSPEQGPARLKQLRQILARQDLHGFIIPRNDAYQGEYVAPRDERLAWLTGFTGSAGFCVVLENCAGVFVDGRYHLQLRDQVDCTVFTPLSMGDLKAADWLLQQLGTQQLDTQGPHRIGFDPWLFSQSQYEAIRDGLAGSAIELQPVIHNPVDEIWHDQPDAPQGKVIAQPVELSGKPHSEKRAEIAKILSDREAAASILSLPDSVAWLLNIRGSDIARNPVPHCFATLHRDASVDLYIETAKVSDIVVHLGADVRLHPLEALLNQINRLEGNILVDKASIPARVVTALTEAPGTCLRYGTDPCILPKACKNPTEITGARAAHSRDAVAMVEFLAWLDQQEPGQFSEIDVVKKLESLRTRGGALRDISFETIAGAGPNGAVVHYRVTHDTNRKVHSGELLLVDSGAQYVDGTTDITRTIAIGPPTRAQQECYTRVLQGMIALSRLRFPRGRTGHELDPIARAPLWAAGLDYDHGTGHGVGSYLSVHEGPQRIAPKGAGTEIALQAGMILSNEPGYYRAGSFGIRIENLMVVKEAAKLPEGDAQRDMFDFETLTWVPLDRKLILADMLSQAEREWIDDYHAETLKRVTISKVEIPETVEAWLKKATKKL